MSYETFFNIFENLIKFVQNDNMAFASFGHCMERKLVRLEDIDYYYELKPISKKAQKCKQNYIYYAHVLVCMLIILRYPNETFENSKGDKTLVKYLTDEPKRLYECGKGLHEFMSEHL